MGHFICLWMRKGFFQKVRVVYSDVESILRVNGGLSAPLKVGRGVRQGCPLSGMLYFLELRPSVTKRRVSFYTETKSNFKGPVCAWVYCTSLFISLC